jgi:hypothetical protein
MGRSFADRREHIELSVTDAWVNHASNVQYMGLNDQYINDCA